MEILYHLTPAANLPTILAGGLSPDCSREHAGRARSVYLAADAGHALAYADHHGDGHTAHVLLRVRVCDLDPDVLCPDDVDLPELMDDWAKTSWIVSLMVSGQCCYGRQIPADVLEMSVDAGCSWSPLTMGPDLTAF